MGMLSEHKRCHRKTVLGSPFCFAHLAEKGIKQEKVYKSHLFTINHVNLQKHKQLFTIF